jgi:predicted ATP-grasp superfamily ATP-dependent carboligase
MTPSEILMKHEDANEYHFHEIDRKWIIEAMEEFATSSQTEISDKVLFEQATVAMEQHYGYGCETEIDAYFRGAKWMQKQFKQM